MSHQHGTERSQTEGCLKEKREARLAAEQRKQRAQKPWERLRHAPETEELPSEEFGEEGLLG